VIPTSFPWLIGIILVLAHPGLRSRLLLTGTSLFRTV